jgi:hypothetical protein
MQLFDRRQHAAQARQANTQLVEIGAQADHGLQGGVEPVDPGVTPSG